MRIPSIPRTREVDGVLQIAVSHEIDLGWGIKLDELRAKLDEAAEGLIDASANGRTEDHYGDTHYSIEIDGWRVATEDDRRRIADLTTDAERARRRAEERQAAELRARRPELFS